MKTKKAGQPDIDQTAQKDNNRIWLAKSQVDTIISERNLIFIDPLSDFGFKRLLSSERNKDITVIESEMVGFLPGRKRSALISTARRRTATTSSSRCSESPNDTSSGGFGSMAATRPSAA